VIVGIAGRKRTGKSTVSAKLVEHGFIEISFAAPIKRAAQVLLSGMGLKPEVIAYHEAHKEAQIDCLGHSYRVLLQALGTDLGRLLNPDIWIHCARQQLKASSAEHVVFSDVRFENEAAFIRDQRGLIIHLVRNTHVVDTHVSESGIAAQRGDALVSNNGTLEGLYNRVFHALNNYDERDQ
jgi:hypothetical protein